jgi:cell division protease FtsH
MNTTAKTLVFWMVILISAIVLWQVVKSSNSSQPAPEISYSKFLSQVNAGNVAAVKISKTRADGTFREGGSFRVFLPESQEQLLATLQAKDVEVWYAESQEGAWSWLTNLAPLLLLAVLWYWMIRRMNTFYKARANSATASGPPGVIG